MEEKLKKAFEIMLKIYSTRGRNDKTTLVKESKDNGILHKLFQLGMDQYLSYGISEKSFQTFIDKSQLYKKPDELNLLNTDDIKYSYDKYLKFKSDLIPYLLEVQSPSSEVLEKLESFFKDLNPIEKYFYYRIIIKNMNLGIGPKSINKAINTLLIKQYTPMLADSGIEKFDKWSWGPGQKKEYYVDTKINGLRLSIFIDVKTYDIEIRTRSGRRFKTLEDYLMKNWVTQTNVKEAIEVARKKQEDLFGRIGIKLFDTDKLVLDCELQHEDKTWESSISVINLKEIEIYEDDNNADEVPLFFLHLFDITTSEPFEPDNFGSKIVTLTFSKRRKILETFIKYMCPKTHKPDRLFKITECNLLGDLSDVEKLAKKYIENGFEGAVVKKPDSIYWAGRGPEWLKIKDIVTYDGTIEEILPGEPTGKYNNTAGKLRVKATINGKEITGTCGSGFKESDRDMLWNNKESMIGKTVEFTVLGKTVKDNFQSGIFKHLRIDK